MKTYQVIIPIKKATGRQFWNVSADSPEEAERIVRNGGGEFESDEIEIEELDNCYEVEELEDA